MPPQRRNSDAAAHRKGVQEHGRLTAARSKAVIAEVNALCARLRPHARALIDGFGIPEPLRYAEMLHPENLPQPATDSDSALHHG